ncbi:helix-turn-helix domain-containing protein [Pseudonocardia pini]|uniref:helix-turn-helix domain-containing protein n=1 Tax=Pseudonocardia pini TaxID=2758030 RepID=UPI0015F0EB2C|nr:helix-turn-helix transcriptional regulator [Pseudonocardia pini]
MSTLGQRLRELRETGFEGESVRQAALMSAFGLKSTSAISGWEKGTGTFPRGRLRDYARFFATPRSVEDGGRLVDEKDLTDTERSTMTALLEELTALLDGRTAVAVSDDPWTFGDHAPIRIVVGSVPGSPYADKANHNYMQLAGLGDVDSLWEIHGHLSRTNPEADIRFVVAEDLGSDDLQCHLVVLGNLAQTQGPGRLLPAGTFPLTQVSVTGPSGDELDGEVFETEEGTRYLPEFTEPEDWRSELTEDVGMLARTQNPHFRERTLSVCSGVFTRGVYGAVRALTHKGLRETNAATLRKQVGDASTWLALFRVTITGGRVTTPDLSHSTLFTWSRPS